MRTPPPGGLSSTRATALYVGALLGPSLLLLPGLAARIAGPASILAWAGLIGLSGLLAAVFSALGTRLPSGSGTSAYTEAGLGPRAGRAVGWCFLLGVVCGAPVVCLIGGAYVAALLGGDRTTAVAVAAGLLIAVVGLTSRGARATTGVQLGLVGLLVVLVAVGVTGSMPAARTANWTPFAPHGWAAVGGAGSVLMLSFVGWEAIAPLTSRLRNPGRQLPRVIAAAFALTSVVYLTLAVATIGVLGHGAGGSVPLAGLLRVAVGPAGPYIAALAAVALTLAATNAYISGATTLAAELRGPDATSGRGPARLQIAIAACGVLLLTGQATGVVTTARLVSMPTTLFLTVYLGCTLAACRILRGRTRLAAALACASVVAVLAFSGWALAVAAAVVAAAMLPRRRRVPAVVGMAAEPTAATAPCEAAPLR